MEKAGNHVVECFGYDSLMPVRVGKDKNGNTYTISLDDNNRWRYTVNTIEGGRRDDFVANLTVTDRTDSKIPGQPDLRLPLESDFVKPQVPPVKTSV